MIMSLLSSSLITLILTFNSIKLVTSTATVDVGIPSQEFLTLNNSSQSVTIERRVKIQPVEKARFEVCYGSLGCFKQERPYFSLERPVIYPPASPQEIGTVFLLFTRENSEFNQSDKLVAENAKSIHRSHFKKDKRVTTIVHGFTSSGDAQWVQILVMELLGNEDMNVIVVSWDKGAEFPYEQAASNTRVVGAQIAQVLKVLIDDWQVRPEDCHLIGHSLGAHIAGYAGERIKNVGRITGLDPASIYFTQNISALRLDPTDAIFVQVIHTNCGELGFGLCDEIGHVDFYVNKADFQPGCLDDKGEIYRNCLKHTKEQATMTDPIEPFTCSHHRSIMYYTESINFPCSYWGFQCANYDALVNGDCWQCALGKTCNVLGHHVVQTAGRRSFRVKTLAKEPFCSYYYKVELSIGTRMSKPPHGNVDVVLTNGTLSRTKNRLKFHFDKTRELHAGKMTPGLFVRPLERLDLMTNVEVSYARTVGFMNFFKYSNHLDVTKIAIEMLNDKAQKIRREFCGGALILTRISAFNQLSSAQCKDFEPSSEFNRINETRFHRNV